MSRGPWQPIAMHWYRTTTVLPVAGESVLAYWERDGRCEPAARYEGDTWHRAACSVGTGRHWPSEPPSHWCLLRLPA